MNAERLASLILKAALYVGGIVLLELLIYIILPLFAGTSPDCTSFLCLVGNIFLPILIMLTILLLILLLLTAFPLVAAYHALKHSRWLWVAIALFIPLLGALAYYSSFMKKREEAKPS